MVAAVSVTCVGLDPKSAGTCGGEAVGAVEGIVGRYVGGARFQIAAVGLFDRVAGQYEDVPLEGCGGGIAAGFAPAHDLALAVCRPGGGRQGGLAAGVVGRG